jgi:hypothetical protein
LNDRFANGPRQVPYEPVGTVCFAQGYHILPYKTRLATVANGTVGEPNAVIRNLDVGPPLDVPFCVIPSHHEQFFVNFSFCGGRFVARFGWGFKFNVDVFGCNFDFESLGLLFSCVRVLAWCGLDLR